MSEEDLHDLLALFLLLMIAILGGGTAALLASGF